ncbi:hypothetical protein TBR22_A13520 [Luteitalea sp. TBR-22]|uniref:hypothetical protein n=1 Tax=Luteitalea sp. TBR-22 TaxID=2802971 RepID=UPI001AF074F6|nr:hypothetical protein [Luteitalea sp. TBR-22]BCS32143.1 hypothetical protein TBR22_A13520 [Luteitalea sp. TBR-22]
MTSQRRGGLLTRASTTLQRTWRQFWWRRGGRDAAARAAGGGEAAPPSPRRHVLQVEDLLLALWIFVLEEGLRRWIGDPVSLLTLGDPMAPPGVVMVPAGAGWLETVAALPPGALLLGGLWLFVLLTRGPEDTDRDVALGRRWPMLALGLPLLSIYALIASAIQSAVGLMPARADGAEPPWPGPLVPRWLRRTAALPLALVGDALFRGGTVSITGAETIMSAGELLSPRLIVAILATVFPFTLLVAGPRIAAGAEMAWTPWIARFAFLHAASFTHFWSRW